MKKEQPKSVDTVLLSIIIALVVGGFLIFSSASLGLLARGGGASYGSEAFSQFLFGIVGGAIALIITSNIHYRHWRKYAFYIFLLSLCGTLAVFIPGVGVELKGAHRWIDLGITTVQPAEFLKIGFVVYLATWLSGMHGKVDSWQYGLLPFSVITGLVAIVMLMQPDTDTFLIIAFAGMAMFLTAGARWSHIAAIIVSAFVLLAILAFMRPYVMDRITTFLDPDADPLGSSYQIQQSLIAVGTGGVTGRGYGQSIQKFGFLPEPTSDSIFAVFAEEFGFIGTSILIMAIVSLCLRGYKTATQTNDMFGTLLVVGFITIITAQAFLNIAAMLALAPMSGLPLPFISHGGTAMLATLTALGIVLNVSKYRQLR